MTPEQEEALREIIERAFAPLRETMVRRDMWRDVTRIINDLLEYFSAEHIHPQDRFHVARAMRDIIYTITNYFEALEALRYIN